MVTFISGKFRSLVSMRNPLVVAALVALTSAIAASWLKIVHPEGPLGLILYAGVVFFMTMLLWRLGFVANGFISAGILTLIAAYYVGVTANLVAEFIINFLLIGFATLIICHVAGVKKASAAIRSSPIAK